MMRIRLSILIYAFGVIVGSALAFAASCYFQRPTGSATAQDTPSSLPGPEELNRLRQDLASLPDSSSAFVKVARLITPSVVNITVSKTVEVRDPWDDFFDDPFFRRFVPRRPPRRFEQQGQGTGFIVTPEGHILTNNHVVENADRILVRLADGREQEAHLIGTDPVTDIAVLKIDARDLPAAELGDSDALQVGEWVIAVGNPFGLQSTVTTGIVSAKGRTHLGILEVEDFIQTDAAINPGNSGGPLVDLRGRVVGINSAIFSRSGGYQGIGFAIPINLARRVKDEILKFGRVRRGTLGIRMGTLRPDSARRLNIKGGAVITEVLPNSPARDAGLRRGDIIVEFAGQPVRDGRLLRSLIMQQEIGKRVPIVILRDGERKTLQVRIEEWSPEY